MTKQEYYDLLVQSAQDGTFPSMDSSGCRYRANHEPSCKRRCAAGILIPDEAYVSSMEMWYVPKVIKPEWLPNGMKVSDIAEVQKAHDDTVRHTFRDWDESYFISLINSLSCFADIIRVYEMEER